MRRGTQPRHLLALTVLVLAACSGSAAGAPSASAPPVAPSAQSPGVPRSPSASATTGSPSTEASSTTVAAGEPWIAYVGAIDDTHVGIRLVGPDRTDDHAASPGMQLPPGGWQNFPDWSPDGRRLAFSADDGGDEPDHWTRDLWIVEVGRPDGVKVLDCVLPCREYSWPAWSPDGRTIAFATFDLVDGIADGSRLLALDVESGTTRVLASTEGPEYILQPRWAPDGRSLVVSIDRFSDTSTSSVQTGTAIAVVDLGADLPAPRRLTEWDRWATYPDWHPTKDLILFSDRPWATLEQGPSNLHTIRPYGSGLADLTNFTSPAERAAQPSWTSDGESIIFTKVEGTGFGEPTMAMVDADGRNFRSATGESFRFGTHARLRPTR